LPRTEQKREVVSVAVGLHTPCPVHAPHAFQVQEAVSQPRLWLPQLPQPWVCAGSPGLQAPAPLQLPHAPHVFQPHEVLQLRVRLWLPRHWPQLCVSVCAGSLGLQAPAPVQLPQLPQPFHAQVALQLRERV